MPCTVGMRACKASCQHRQLVSEYRDIHDAWEALRESGDYMRMEDDEFRVAHPEPTFKDFLIAREGT